MIIDRAAGVTPTRFVDRGLRQEIGGFIGKATRDDMLRTFLWVSECQIAQEICTAWEELITSLDNESRDADCRRAATERPPSWRADSRDEIAKDCHQASSALLAELRSEIPEARQAHRECTQVLYQLSSRLGQAVTNPVPVTDSAGTPLLDTLTPLRDQLAAATERLKSLVAQDREKLHDLAVQESYRRQSTGSNSSVPLKDIDAMPPSEFIGLVETLLQRDGFRTARPDGASEEFHVLAVCPQGHTFVFNSHRVRGPQGWKPEPAAQITTPSLHAARLVAERRKPDVFVVITNGGFSEPARRYADEHAMCLVDRRSLQRWAEWEEPMECVEDHEQGVA
ncbi:restriction endonuclease [Streptomyces sp. DT193]|uniref:restriction endonuclease n=1 Tax=Streptomyces sp. DT193 TaxID=3393418 RepID=UPI003CF12391